MQDAPPPPAISGSVPGRFRSRGGTRPAVVYGPLAGLFGTVAMVLATVVVLGIASAVLGEWEVALVQVGIFLVLGGLYAVLIGPISGLILSLALDSMGQVHRAPAIGAALPTFAIFSGLFVSAVLFGFFDAGITAIGIIAAVIYTPIGWRTGKWYATKMLG